MSDCFIVSFIRFDDSKPMRISLVPIFGAASSDMARSRHGTHVHRPGEWRA